MRFLKGQHGHISAQVDSVQPGPLHGIRVANQAPGALPSPLPLEDLPLPRISPHPISIALDQFISPQLGAARKAKIKGESRSCVFIFSLLEGN